jgi:chromosome segregation ATPase
MLKRKAMNAADNATDSPKKPRTSSMDDMKTRLDAMLKKAAEQHESARIAAIDKASGLEDELNDAREERDSTENELNAKKTEFSETSSYLETIGKSETLRMLQNASSSDNASSSSDIETLTQQNSEVQELMSALRDKNKSLSNQIGDMNSELEEMRERCTVLAEEYDAAELHVQTITKIGGSKCVK